MSWFKFVTSIVRLYYRLMYKIELNGMENIPKEGGFLICCNHKSNNDPPFIGSFLPVQVAFLAKKELFIPIFGSIIKSLGAIPLERNSHDVTAIKTSMSIMRGGKGLLVFPQGGRRKELSQKDFRPGSLMMAYRTKVPVIPALIEGNYKFGTKITISIGCPISAEELSGIIGTASEQEKNSILSNLIYNRIISLAKG